MKLPTMKLSFGKTAVAALALMTIAYGIAEYRGPNGYAGLMQKREQLRTLEQENVRLRSEIDRLDKNIERLKDDPKAQDLEVRRRLGKVGPTDKVYVLPEKPKSTLAATGVSAN